MRPKGTPAPKDKRCEYMTSKEKQCMNRGSYNVNAEYLGAHWREVRLCGIHVNKSLFPTG